jgi:hypothetical protein
MSAMWADRPAPIWLWNLARWGLLAALAGSAALAFALANGLADPPRPGPLRLSEDFKADTSRWTFLTFGGASLETASGALRATFPKTASTDPWAAALSDGPHEAFSLEIGGASDGGLAYGVVFGWQDAAHHSAVLVNANGYARAYRQRGTERQEWFIWQQWPHILAGANRVRVDVIGPTATVRINDEWLVDATVEGSGKIGVIAQGHEPGQVIFSWVKLWAGP